MMNSCSSTERTYSKSCQLPQGDAEPHPITKSVLLNNSFEKVELSLSCEKAAKVLHIFIVVAFLCLFLYIWIIIDPITHTKSTSTHRNDCFDSFRRNNCSLDNYSSTICRDLYACISNEDQAPPSSSSSSTPAESKISSIEEFLENCLLIFGGMGFTGVLTRLVFRFRFLHHTIKKLGRAVVNGLRTPKKVVCPIVVTPQDENLYEEGNITDE